MCVGLKSRATQPIWGLGFMDLGIEGLCVKGLSPGSNN